MVYLGIVCMSGRREVRDFLKRGGGGARYRGVGRAGLISQEVKTGCWRRSCNSTHTVACGGGWYIPWQGCHETVKKGEEGTSTSTST
jgi:hypothetical protein